MIADYLFLIKESFFSLLHPPTFYFSGCSNKTFLQNHPKVVPGVELSAVDVACHHGPDAAHWGMPLIGVAFHS